MNKLEELR